MASFNSFTLIGNLAADPELRYTPNGSPVCTFPMAINSRRKTSEGKHVDHVDYFRITTKNKTAEACAKFLAKGRPVFVTGELESWKNETKFGINFVATNVQFLGSNKGAAAGGEAGSANGDGWTEEMREFRDAMGDDMPN